MSSQAANRLMILVAIASAVVTVVVGWRSVSHLDMLWDEQVDHRIAVGLAEHPLMGAEPTLDASQMRLPMYVNAAVYAVTGRDDLAVSRGVSLAVAAITVLSAAALGRALFGSLVGALTAVLLSLSPYFLSFARISMTEGDIFFACFTTLAILGFVRYMQSPTPGRWLLAGGLLALAVGAKIFALVLIPVFVVLVTSSHAIRERTVPSNLAVAGGHRRLAGQSVLRLHIVLACGLALCLAVGVFSWAVWFPDRAGSADSASSVLSVATERMVFQIGWVGLAALWGYAIWLALRRRALAQGQLVRLVGLIAFAILTCCVLMPVHLIDHDIARTTLRRLLSWDDRIPLALWSDHIRLYTGIVLVKLTVPLGVLTAVAIVFAGIREHEDGRWRACILTFVFLFVGLCFLPLRQTFYIMGVYPLLMIITAAFAVHLGQWLGGVSRRLLWLWSACVVVLLIHLAVSTYNAFPHYHLHGYSLVGDVWLGRESRGYRNLIQTSSDGAQTLIRWCNTSPEVRPGARIVSYLWEDQPGQIVDQVPPSSRYELVRRGLSDGSDEVPPQPSIEDADFVLLHVNNLLGYGDRAPDWPIGDTLARRFEKVFTVRRGELEVAWVFGRRGAAARFSENTQKH